MIKWVEYPSSKSLTFIKIDSGICFLDLRHLKKWSCLDLKKILLYFSLKMTHCSFLSSKKKMFCFCFVFFPSKIPNSFRNISNLVNYTRWVSLVTGKLVPCLHTGCPSPQCFKLFLNEGGQLKAMGDSLLWEHSNVSYCLWHWIISDVRSLWNANLCVLKLMSTNWRCLQW